MSFLRGKVVGYVTNLVYTQATYPNIIKKWCIKVGWAKGLYPVPILTL